MPVVTTNLELAVSDLQQGKPVAIPTETVYGLAALITNDQAIKAVFAMKNRPLNHPLIVHVAVNADLSNLVDSIPEYAQKLMQHFWPGPLTLVLNCKKNQVNPLITGGQSTVAIRCPAHPVAQELLSLVKTPLVAPSANPFGKISPTTAEHVRHSFPDEELTIVDGGRCSVGIESTIVDASEPDGYQILRHGLIDEQAIAAVINTDLLTSENTIRVPGKLDSHYQPQKTLYYFENYEQLENFCLTHSVSIYAIASKKPKQVEEQHFYLQADNPEKAAYDLYFQLRKADESSASCIVIQLPPAVGAWQGLRERILKAGQAV